MAHFNSTQNGNWADGGTWGNTSPGTAGVDYPGVNDDTATMTHTVTYNAGDSSVVYGVIIISSPGVFTFPTNANSTLSFSATATLAVNSGAELRIGTSGTPIGSAYHCYLHWAQGTSDRYTLIMGNGSTINCYGDSAFYVNKYADLDANWTTGQSFYVSGDRSTWTAGLKFWIHENKDLSTYYHDSEIYTIASVGTYDSGNDRTQITISEAAPGKTFTAIYQTHQSELIIISRNVFIGDPSAPQTADGHRSYAERLRMDENQGNPTRLHKFNNTRFSGYNRLTYGGYNTEFEDCTFVCNNCGVGSDNVKVINCDSIGNYENNRFMDNSIVSGGNVCCCNNGMYTGSGTKYSCNFIGCNDVGGGTAQAIDGDIISCNYALMGTANCTLNGGDIKSCNGVSRDTRQTLVKNCNLVNTPFALYTPGQDFKETTVYDNCTVNGATQRDIRVYTNSGEILPVISGEGTWQTPPSANDYIMSMNPNSACADNGVRNLSYSELNPMGDYATSGSKTLTFSIYPVGWTTALDNDDIVLDAEYMSSATATTLSKVTNTTATYANGGWRNLSVTFNPLQAGIVYFNITMNTYESGCYVLVDPVWSLS